jgi:hypothetical protein
MIIFFWTRGTGEAGKEGSPMRRMVLAVALPALSFAFASSARGDATIGVAAGAGGLNEFHFALCEHYHVPHSTVIVVRKHIPDDDLPVVFFISQRARVTPDAVVALRMRGMSWMDVAFHFKLTADVFHVHFARDPGPPYGVAHGYYRRRKQSEWASIRLADADMVHLVNVKFLAERHGCAPDDVIKLRAEGKGYGDLHVNLKASFGKAAGGGPPGKGAPGKGGGPPGNDGKGKAKDAEPPKARGGPAAPGGGRGGGKGRGR